MHRWLQDRADDASASGDDHMDITRDTPSDKSYDTIITLTNGYTVTFEDVGTPYAVQCVGANHNIGDVKNVNQVSLIVGNSAGLIQVTSGSGLSSEQATMLE